MNKHMVFVKEDDGLIRAGGFIVNDATPITTLPDGLAIPAGLYTMYREPGKRPFSMEPTTSVTEPSLCDYLFDKIQTRKKRETRKRRVTKGNKRKTPRREK